ncbi:tyrosine-type recombinase/integrase [Spirosoma rigui]|uniref:tyrosine-type recombinase/integrase n=1 Tax=Spirosoma rigui TaxID=564064 RepID=UPI0009AFD135|nr:tyrosine-type recombinase/integrase [Spirosoma rigui]
MKTATATLFYDTRRSSADGSFVRLSIYANQKQKLFTTGEKVSPEDWKFLERTKGGLPGTVKNEDRQKLWQRFYGRFTDELGKQHDGYLIRAQSVIEKLGDDFTFDAFADALANYGKEKEKPAEQTDLIAALLAKAKSMSNAGRVGNAINYELAAKSLRRFVESFTDEERREFLKIPIPRRSNQPRTVAKLHFDHLTAEFLTTYEQWMQHYGKAPQSKLKASTGASLTTVGIYLRHVRSVVNDAIEAGLMSRDVYPFGRNRYVIPAGANVKKALSKEYIEQIKAYQPIPGTSEQRSHDLWLFSYFCNGANLTDICRLTWNRVDLKEGKLTFIRQKTARSKKQSQTPIVAHLRSETIAIIERWGTTDRRSNTYVFPFLNVDMTDQQKKQAVHQTVKMTNKWMRKIAEQLGIEADVNTYSARHSFATSLLKSKAPLAFISKSLGHTNIKTTENYLGSFDDDEAKAFLSAL